MRRCSNQTLTGLYRPKEASATKRRIAVEFRVLGPLAVVEDGRPVPLDRRRTRALLAFLLLHANELVSSDRLVDEVWGPDPPKTAAASLQNYISRLRKAIGPELVVSQPPGYILRIDPGRFDLARFQRLTAEARGAEPRERAEKLRAALQLWRGPALEDLAFEPFARDEIGRLEEARLAALEERIDADLELGRDGDLVGELEELVEEHPLRERFRAQLMRALYRAGRQADALAVFQTARQVLRDELGLEPGEELRELQQAILQQDPSLGPRAGEAVEHAADRRTVSVLVCDLVGSNKLAAQLDPEAYRALLSRYFELVRVPIERHGGTAEKFIGDAVVAVFGVPELHEDDALRAVRAAIEARDSLREAEIAARIGVSTGEVHVLSAPGDELDLAGAAASVAAQLELRAPSGGVLVSDETYALTQDSLRAEQIDGAWLADDVVSERPAYARRLDAPLVGRTEELSRLHAAYAEARDGKHARVVTILGEAGIGKTRLMRELIARMGDEGRVMVGRCISYGEGATYLPIAEIVEQATRELSLEGITALLEGEDDAEQVAQQIAELIGVAERPAAPGEAFWGVRRFVEALARRQPIVLVLDDIHWAEPTLLDLIEYLGEWVDAPVLILCAARSEMLDERPGWGGPTSTGFLVELDPLEPPDVSTLVLRLAKEALDPEIEERIVEQAGGNPLYAEQLVALAREAADVPVRETPPTVEALIASRLARLDPRELAVLRRGSVIGRLFSREELDDLTPAEDTERTERHLVDLTQRALVHPGADRFRFHHVLVRDVVYRGIPKSERAQLHELAARGFERRNASDEVTGYHFEQAYRYLNELASADEHTRELAIAGGERLGRAGIRAWKRADAPAGINLLSRAVELAPDELELRCELGAALHARGETMRAREILEAGARDAKAKGDERLALRARVELAFAASTTDPTHANELLELADEAIPRLVMYGDDRAVGRALLCVAHFKGGFLCQYAAAEQAAARAVTHYRRAGWSPSNAIGVLASALYYGPTPVEEAVSRSHELLREHAGDHASEANVLLWLGGLEAMLGRFDEGRAHVLMARRLYEDLGLRVAAVDACAQILGDIEMLAGDPPKAEEEVRRAGELLEEIGQTGVLASRAGQLAAALVAQGRIDEAEQWTATARSHAAADDLDAAIQWQPAQARILATRGQIEEAERLVRETLARIERTDALNRRADTLLVLAEILRITNRHDEANAGTQAAVQLYTAKGNVVSAKRAESPVRGSPLGTSVVR